ncbi:hypothetical protein CDL12_16935 [Handroanthus impetiginosus]|uniref:Putative plant transposon protein domain-containing protein n=1 Tax=Handroanthus impetiginosus TaxID=429701 RepID=A0A2G9GYW1_9LAMI|nr:hypothetical protein CDL12_16935 [Handroanthus impetiginosus]
MCIETNGGGEITSIPSYDDHCFISKEAEDYHNTTILNNNLVKEPSLAEHEKIMHRRHWEEFMAKLESVNHKPMDIPRSLLTNKAWDWLHFINTHLYPSSYSSKVNKNRAFILFAILTDIPLDIKRYIHKAIKKSVRDEWSMKLYFPNLITALCKYARLVNQPGNKVISRTPLEVFPDRNPNFALVTRAEPN